MKGARLISMGAAVCSALLATMVAVPAAASGGAARPEVSGALTRADLGPSWRPGCPVTPRELRRVTADFINFQGRTKRGSIIVHRGAVSDVIAFFNAAKRLRFPLKGVAEARDTYGRGTTPKDSDRVLMDRNLTSGFNCRPIGESAEWALHARGLAIDVNPVQNPYTGPGGPLPAAGSAFAEGRDGGRGVLTDDHPLVRLMERRGWTWGGRWQHRDYQHFEKPRPRP
jgi:hypothetical protein